MNAESAPVIVPEIAILARVFDEHFGSRAIAVASSQAIAARGEIAATWSTLVAQIASMQALYASDD